MRKIIDGKLYDTDKAREVGRWSNGWGGPDYASTELYRKRTGEYFARVVRGEYVDDLGYLDTIIPMSYAEAKEWAERHLATDEYEDEFDAPDEDETAVLSLTVPAATYRAIKDEATRRGCSMRDMVVGWAETLAKD